MIERARRLGLWWLLIAAVAAAPAEARTVGAIAFEPCDVAVPGTVQTFGAECGSLAAGNIGFSVGGTLAAALGGPGRGAAVSR